MMKKRSGKQRTTSADRPRIPILKYSVLNYVCVNKPAGTMVHRSSGSLGHKHVSAASCINPCWETHNMTIRKSIIGGAPSVD
eukprot:scaffold92596_cov54-Attheya_sp.AAC.1